MAYSKPNKQTIPTPATATEELHNSFVAHFTNHFAKVLTPTIMITARKGAYATVINSTYDNTPIEQVLGSDNAKALTEQVLNNISAGISAVPAI